LYCEEIDVGEGTPRQIASGLRPHFTEEQMLGQRLLVVCNLKAKNLVGFKSHGMVLCAAATNPDSEEQQRTEIVEFVEPPPDAILGEVITFEGLPPPQPWSAAQVEKKKVFAGCMDGMKTSDDCKATWNGHVFMTSAGPCTTKSIAGGVLR
jgi:aminoacyl tRNA synthase complex-interacting multifunctional protein 1